MKKSAILLVLALAFLLAACSRPPTFPNVAGTWFSDDAVGSGCAVQTMTLTLDLTQTGPNLSGDFRVEDAYGTDMDGVGEFSGTITTEGEVTGEVTMVNETGAGGPTIEFEAEGTVTSDGDELDADFVAVNTIDCGGTPTTVTFEATFTKTS